MGRNIDEPATGDLTEHEQLSRELDAALEATFPASDPPAVTQPVRKPPGKSSE